MSYDLYFCRTSSEELLFSDVVAWSHRFVAFKMSGETQLWYANEDTGVYFALEYNLPSERNDLDLPPDVFDTGLCFNLNYVRPTFFALEAMPIVAALARYFGLTMFDPQGDPCVGMFSGKQLTESWSKSNTSAVGVMAAEGASFSYLSPATAARFWDYMSRYRTLTEELRIDDVFVPRKFLVSLKDSQQAGTAAVWTQGVHLVLPRTDWIYVVYPKNFWRRENKTICFSSETVLTAMAQYLRGYDEKRELRILPRENLEKADKALKALPGGLPPRELTRLAPDRCVDVPFGRFAGL